MRPREFGEPESHKTCYPHTGEGAREISMSRESLKGVAGWVLTGRLVSPVRGERAGFVIKKAELESLLRLLVAPK
jgi:hypothetical protein